MTVGQNFEIHALLYFAGAIVGPDSRLAKFGALVANDTQIRDLCEQLLVCKDDAQCVMLVTRLRLLLHEHLQDLRNKFMVHAATVSEIEKAS